jgi:hypothetical protein
MYEQKPRPVERGMGMLEGRGHVKPCKPPWVRGLG